MQYVGSKNRISKELVPIIQGFIKDNTIGYLEPMVGGANVIDKINHHNKIGCDINEYLIELLKYAQVNDLPDTITEEEYIKVKNNKEKYPKWYVGLIGFCGSFGAKFFGGFAVGNDKRDRYNEAVRNIKKQNLKNIKFKTISFLDLPKDKLKGYVIYCDIPYRNTTKYSTENFPYDEFYEWCIELSKENTVLISEYDMPKDFECIWEKEHYSSLGGGVNNNNKLKKIEKLFIVKK